MLPTLTIDAELVSSKGGPDWLRRERTRAWERFAARGLPTTAEEIWRYSRVDELDLSRYTPLAPGSTSPVALPTAVQGLLAALGPAATVVVSGNGGGPQHLAPQSGVSVGLASGPLFPLEGPAAHLGGPPPDAWVDLNQALVDVPWRISVAAGVVVKEPIVIVHALGGDRGCFFPRLEVELGAGAQAQVIEVVTSDDSDALVVPVSHLAVGPGAHLGFAHAQLLGPMAWQLGNQASLLERDAVLVSMTLSLGGSYARTRTGSVLNGPGAESQLLAAYFGSGRQMHDLRTVQHHAAPRCRSDLVFKGVVADHAHSVYSGLIRVEKGAKGTNAFQVNRNLVLSEGARAESVPNLEIEDNDVRCSHASAVGPIDDSQLFYLESRGVPTVAAQRLVALGFLDEVLDRCPVRSLKDWLHGQMAAKLESSGFVSSGHGL